MISVTDVVLRLAPQSDREHGVLAFVGVTLADRIKLDGLTLRRSRDGTTRLVYPTRIDGSGRERAFVRPADEAVRRAIENAVIEELIRRQRASGTEACRPPVTLTRPAVAPTLDEEVDQ